MIIIASATKGAPSYSSRTECQAVQNSNNRNNLMMHWKNRGIHPNMKYAITSEGRCFSDFKTFLTFFAGSAVFI